jgi:ubiquinol-cytochrome c reductase cytochrome c subunit
MRRRVATLTAVVAAVAAAAPLTAVQLDRASAAQDDNELVARGEQLYLTGCVSCHGTGGVGVAGLGPSLIGAGAASAYFFLSTGRMPAVEGESGQATRKQPAYDAEEIDALVAYVASLGEGPPIPVVDLETADLARGGVLYRANCASCHNASGVGGALSYGDTAPSLHESTPVQVVAAMRVGPGQMPVFDEATLDEQAANDIAAYVEYLRDPDDPGGLSLGRIGPVTEGFIALVVGLGGLCVIGAWIVGRRRRHG